MRRAMVAFAHQFVVGQSQKSKAHCLHRIDDPRSAEECYVGLDLQIGISEQYSPLRTPVSPQMSMYSVADIMYSNQQHLSLKYYSSRKSIKD